MQRWLVVLACLVLAPALARAASVDKLVEQAIDALDNTCYEARMRFVSGMDSDEVQEVLIHHVTPDLYRVEPLEDGEPSGVYYIENGKELVRVDNGNGDVPIVQPLPRRQFHLDDILKAKFLQELAEFKGSMVLSGTVGDFNVYVLRQDAHADKPYTITVGLDKRNYFPLYLEVRDINGRRLVYFEITVIQYLPRLSLADSLFEVPEQSVTASPRAPRQPQTVANSTAVSKAPACPLPPYPKQETLPSGYEIEGLTLLHYPRTVNGKQVQSVVYQYEILGPGPDDVMSLFLTRDLDVEFFMDKKDPEASFGYLVRKQGDWLIAVFADQPADILAQVIEGLQEEPGQARELLEVTEAREAIVQKALGESR